MKIENKIPHFINIKNDKETKKPNFKTEEAKTPFSYECSNALKANILYENRKYEEYLANKNVFQKIFSNGKLKNKDNNSFAANILKSYQEGFISFEDFINKYSEIKFYDDMGEVFGKYEYGAYSKIKEGGIQSSNIEMLALLVKEGKISNETVKYMRGAGRINKNAEDDLDKLYDACSNGLDIKNVFCPSFKDETDALLSVKTGDVCTLNGKRNIHIKNSEGKLEELFIGPDTYLELFPPVERYSYTQGEIGDCFLIAALYLVYSNPNTRERLLQIFKENNDGTISLSLDGYKNSDDEIILKNPDSFELKDLKKSLNKYNPETFSYTCEGIRGLEILFEKDSQYNADKSIKKQYKKLSAALNAMGNKENIKIDGFNYSKEEIQIFLNLAEDYLNGNRKNRLMSHKDAYLGKVNFSIFPETYTKREMKWAGKYAQYMYLIHKRGAEYAEENGLGIEGALENPEMYLPLNVYTALWGCGGDYKKPYTDGGYTESALERLGFKDLRIETKNNYDKNALIYSPNAGSEYFMSAEANRDYKSAKGFSIFSNHAYAINVIDNKNQEFSIVNPYNTAWEMISDGKELVRAFSYLHANKIKS